MTPDYLHIILSLFFVMICLGMSIYLFKRVHFNTFQKNQPIKIINTLPIGPKEKLMLVEVNDLYLLLGATSTHIETLYVFNELPNVKIPAENKVAESGNGHGFLEKMRVARKKRDIIHD